MTSDAGSASTLSGVPVVRGRVVLRSRVALATHGIILGNEFIAMGVVAVAANDASLMHFTLDEGAIDIDFIANLAIWPIQGRVDECQAVGIQ
jgi:hypothetical protein